MAHDLTFFKECGVRRHFDEKAAQWLFLVIDVVAVLIGQSDYKNEKSYWATLKSRLKKERSVVADITELNVCIEKIVTHQNELGTQIDAIVVDFEGKAG
jgi:hypothetical protein